MSKAIFDECVKQAIKLGRSWMDYPEESNDKPTKEEWQLAILLYMRSIENL